MTIANDVPFTVALVANALSLPGISLQSARYASNKILMKNQFVKHGVPTPKSEILGNKKDFLKLVSKKSFPLILKPSDGRGGRGVLYLDKSVDLNWAWNFVFEISDNKELMLEEYVAGDQLSVEGIFIKKKFHPIAFADRNYEDDGNLVSRSKDNALITNPDIAKKHVLKMVKNQALDCYSGKEIPCKIDSVCIHGDNESSLATAKSIKDNLIDNGLELKPLNKMKKFI